MFNFHFIFSEEQLFTTRKPSPLDNYARHWTPRTIKKTSNLLHDLFIFLDIMGLGFRMRAYIAASCARIYYIINTNFFLYCFSFQRGSSRRWKTSRMSTTRAVSIFK